MEISNVSTNKFKISWTPVPQASTIEIEIYPATERFPNGIINLPESQREFELDNLQAETRYYIKLSCIINGRTR